MEVIIEKVTKKYGHHVALKGIDLHLTSGLIGLLGPNGSGKTTLMQMMATLQPPTSGTITIGEFRIGDDDQSIRRLLGYLPQHFGLYPDLTGEQFLDFIAGVKGYKDSASRKREVAAKLELVNLKDQGKRKIKSYSGGMKQRIGIAQALIGDPPLIIMDEPTVGLDPEERLRLRNELTEIGTGRIVILSTHIVSDIEDSCSHLILMNKGKVMFADTPEQLLASIEGRVWSGELPSREWRDVDFVGKVIRKKMNKSGMELRVLADEQPFPEAKQVPAELEDAYIHLTGGGV